MSLLIPKRRNDPFFSWLGHYGAERQGGRLKTEGILVEELFITFLMPCSPIDHE
jgi:hypothetical protein